MIELITKHWKVLLIYSVVLIGIGVIGGALLAGPHYTNNTVNQTNAGNIIAMHALSNYTNDITNVVTITNIQMLWVDDSHYNMDPFTGQQKNDSFEVGLYKRKADFKLQPWIAEKKLFIGGGVSYSWQTNLSVDIIAGYNLLDWLGVDIHCNTSLEIGADLFIRL